MLPSWELLCKYRMHSSHLIVVVLISLAAGPLAVDGLTCPDRVSPQPGETFGQTLPWKYTGRGDGLSLFSGEASKAYADCCPRGSSVANWTVGLSTGFQWIASLAATCTDGTPISSVVLGWNGSDPTACNASVAQKKTVNVTHSDGSFSARASMVLQQLFGVGAPDPFDYPQVFECPSGMVPQGFSARSACYSIVDVQVLCAPPYIDGDPVDPITVVLQGDAQTCPSSAVMIPAEGLGTADAYISTYNDTNYNTSILNPAYVSAAGPVQSDCCSSSRVQNWTVNYNSYASGFVGYLQGSCEDGNILKPLRYGLNETGFCDQSLPSDVRQYPAWPGLFVRTTNNSIDLISDYNASYSTYLECPNSTYPIGYTARSSCFSLADLKIVCGSGPVAPVPAPLQLGSSAAVEFPPATGTVAPLLRG